MRILAIETSCDETAASVVSFEKEHGIIESNVIATSLALHAKTGGIIPEVAARNQVEYIIPVIIEALQKAKTNSHNIDAIAVTYGPGLIGSLLVGVETAKTLSYVWDKPLIPVNHLFGHIYANWLMADSKWPMVENNHTAKRAISNKPYAAIAFPAIALIVSGGHTDLVLMKNHKAIQWLGGTRDDASGEALDKIGRMLSINYPAGAEIEQLAKKGNPKAFRFPRPIKHDGNFDFSFSGLKTAVMREINSLKGEPLRGKGEGQEKNASRFTVDALPLADIARCTQDAIFDVLVYKTLKAAKEYNAKSILLGGGVAANETLRELFQNALNTKYQILDTKLFAPAKNLCTDNAAMIAAAAYYQGHPTPWEEVTANPELYFD